MKRKYNLPHLRFAVIYEISSVDLMDSISHFSHKNLVSQENNIFFSFTATTRSPFSFRLRESPSRRMKETKKGEKIPSRAITLIAFLLLLGFHPQSHLSAAIFIRRKESWPEDSPTNKKPQKESPLSYPKTRGANNAEVDDDPYLCG